VTSRKAVSAATMVVLIGLLIAGAWFGWQSISAPLPGDDEPTKRAKPRCEGGFAKGDLVQTGDVTVSVFNAGSRSGLADQTLSELSARGFERGAVGNAPTELETVQFVRVLARSAEDPTARLVALQFGSNTLVQASKKKLGPGVDIIVGDGFLGLVDAPAELTVERAFSSC
jgi:hypothetical protein